MSEGAWRLFDSIVKTSTQEGAAAFAKLTPNLSELAQHGMVVIREAPWLGRWHVTPAEEAVEHAEVRTRDEWEQHRRAIAIRRLGGDAPGGHETRESWLDDRREKIQSALMESALRDRDSEEEDHGEED
jgi:hypothetical protein